MDRPPTELIADELPPTDSASYFVLSQLAVLQDHRPYDPFDMVAESEPNINVWLREWREAHPDEGARVDVSDLVDADVIVQHASRSGKYTFATPYQYKLMRKRQTAVMVSYAWNDRDSPPLKRFLAALGSTPGVKPTHCTQPEAQVAMALPLK